MHRIVKQIHMCYGHRLMDYDGKCAHAHGHNGLVEIELATDALNSQGMVCDFGEVKTRLKEFIDRELDHRMILREDDPLVGALTQIGERPYVIKENPTAENIAHLIYREAKSMHLPVVAVKLWETESSMAEYREGAVGGPVR
jgi:6-pyruvoyltetrahydropterin/6-carboxytetrahydropterin synthase